MGPWLLFTLLLLTMNGIIPCQSQVLEEQVGPSVKTVNGLVTGKTIMTTFKKPVDCYFGIPFAQPPVGQLRFRNPLPVSEGNINATQFGFACPQRRIKGMSKFVRGIGDALELGAEISEDCLYLNVWTPSPKPDNLTVIVFIHGGGLIIGAGSMPSADGSTFVALENVVYVTINYRLGPLGFLYLNHQEVDANVGFMDQVMALKWVRDNIAAFGGDPNRVTLMGESAGAVSAAFHMVSPLSKGLFQRAILQSESALYDMAVASKSKVENVTYKMAEFMECPTSNASALVECFREKDVMKLVKSVPFETTVNIFVYPVVDGKFLVKHPADAYKDGDYGKFEILTGFNKDEATLFFMLFNPFTFNPLVDNVHIQEKELAAIVTYLFNNANNETKLAATKHYNKGPEKDYLSQAAGIFEDYVVDCGIVRTMKSLAETGNTVYGYYFTHRSSLIPLAKWLGVPHALELLYLSGYPFKNELIFTEEDRTLAKRMIRYWSNFAKSGNPNVPNLVDSVFWPAYTSSEHRQLVLAPMNQTILYDFKKEDCKFWDEMGILEPRDSNLIEKTI